MTQVIAILADTATDAPNLSALWIVASLALHALVSIAVGYTLYRVRSRDKAIDDRLGRSEDRIGRAESGLSEAIQASVIHDKRIETLMAREFVPRSECQAFRGEIRDTSTRLFSKVEVVQQGTAATKAVCDAILQRLNAGGGNQP